MAILELDQSHETPLTEIHRGPFKLRYAYARSKDCQESGEKGQDYLVWRTEHFRAAFALCDGVGQSYFGGIGAQIVGEAIMEWLWKLPLENEPRIADSQGLIQALQNFLDSKKALATKIIGDVDIKSVESELIRDALEARRKTRGTQSNFVCGIIDIPNQFHPKGRVLLFWLGDAKLKIWKNDTNQTPFLKANWNKQDGWSSLFGTSGEIRCFQGTLDDLDCVIAHSDGVDPVRPKLSPALTLTELDRQLGQLGDDDVSYLELFFSNPSPNLEDDLVSEIRESPPLPVQIIFPPTKVSPAPNYSKDRKPGIPDWIYIVSILVVVLCSLISGGAGYWIRGQNASVSPPLAPPLPTIGAPKTPLPGMTPLLAPAATPAIAPTRQAAALSIPPVFVVLIGPRKAVIFQENDCHEVAENSYILVRGAIQVWAFTSTACQGVPVELIQNGTYLSLGNDIHSIKIEVILPHP